MAELPAGRDLDGEPVAEANPEIPLDENKEQHDSQVAVNLDNPLNPSRTEASSPDHLTTETSIPSDAKSRRRAAIIQDAAAKFEDRLATRISDHDLHHDIIQMYQQAQAILARINSTNNPDSKLNMLALASSISDIQLDFDINAPLPEKLSPKQAPSSIGNEPSPSTTDGPPSPRSGLVAAESSSQDPVADLAVDEEAEGSKASGTKKKDRMENEECVDKELGPKEEAVVETKDMMEEETLEEMVDPRKKFRDTMLCHAQEFETDDLVSLLGYMKHIVDGMSSVLDNMETVMQAVTAEEDS